MNKKRLLSLALSLVLLTPTVGFAKGNTHNTATKSEQSTQQKNVAIPKQNNVAISKQNNEAKINEKKKQIEDFKTQLKAKHETMKQIRQQTIEIKNQIQTKKVQLNSIIDDIKAGNKTLSADTLAALLSKIDNLKIYSDKVKTTAEISKEVTDVQKKVNSKDFSNALSSLDKVIAKLQARLDNLKKLNTALDDTLAIANLATAPAPTAPTSETTTTTATN